VQFLIPLALPVIDNVGFVVKCTSDVPVRVCRHELLHRCLYRAPPVVPIRRLKMNTLTNSQIISHLSLDTCSQQTEQDFATKFGKMPQWVVAAPGRVNLIGEHTDYNGGFVLPMAIERYVVIAADLHTEALKPGHGNSATFHTANLGESFQVPLDEIAKSEPKEWSNYVKGVLAGFLERKHRLPSFDAVIHSSVPLGGGLSSSAALEVAVATLLEAILDTSLLPTEKALLCQQAEHQFAGVPCGIMDQFSSIFGQEDTLMLIDCDSQQVQPIAFTTPDLTVLITNSSVNHALVGGEYRQRRQQCETAATAMRVASLRNATLASLHRASDQLDEVICRRARHVITENARTLEAAKAIGQEDWTTVGELMFASHASLRDDYEVSCDELDILVEIAREIGIRGGVYGSRMTGGGFGGCTVSLVKTDSLSAIMQTLRTRYFEKTGIKPTLFVTRPARGAHVIRE